MNIIKAKRFSKKKITKKKVLNDAVDDFIVKANEKKLPDWIRGDEE